MSISTFIPELEVIYRPMPPPSQMTRSVFLFSPSFASRVSPVPFYPFLVDGEDRGARRTPALVLLRAEVAGLPADARDVSCTGAAWSSSGSPD
jgi:hypothetical protein